MPNKVIARTFWYEEKGETLTLTQEELLKRSESLVVLGEAGMGKTELMKWLGEQAGYEYLTARKLGNRPAPPNKDAGAGRTLAIDALDELSTRSEGDAVGIVLRKLGELKYPKFVMSCRVADWRHATALEAIGDFYAKDQVLAVYLRPLDPDEVLGLLAEQVGGVAKAREVIAHMAAANLPDLLTNPQTLQMIAAVVRKGPLPNTTGALFGRAVEELRREHRHEKVELQPDEESALDAAGAAFATLILTGSDALVLGVANPADGELPLAELLAMPSAKSLAPTVGTRLFATAGAAERFTYAHRRIGEFLGSRWLARQADTVMKRRRLMAMFRSHGVVPASLRGLHAWLVYHQPALGAEVIAADPLGVIEYGDAGSLSPALSNQLLDALSGIAERTLSLDGRQRFQVASLLAPELRQRVRGIISNGLADFAQRLIVLDAVKCSSVAHELRADLAQLLQDRKTPWSIRLRALEVLRGLGGEDWQAHLDALLDGGEVGWQIMQALEEIGLDAFDDRFLVRCVVAHALGESASVSMLMRLESLVPDGRVERILDELVTQMELLGEETTESGLVELNAFGFEVLSRRLELDEVDPARVWRWLRPLRADTGYRRTGNDKVAARLATDTSLRQTIQKLVLLDGRGNESIRMGIWRLTTRSRGLAVTEADLVQLLDALQPKAVDDQIWRDLLCETRHSDTEGSAARAAAKRLVADRPDMLTWIDKLTIATKPEWQERSEQKQRARAAKQEKLWKGHREQIAPRIEDLRRGDFAAIFEPACAYLSLYSNLPHGTGGPDRLIRWLGQALAEAALNGFEAYLQSSEPPSAQDVAEANSRCSRINGSYVVVAALAERLRTGKGLEDVADDRLAIGFYEARHGSLEEHAKIQGFAASLEAEIRRRNLMEQVLRGWVEPQLANRLAHADQIHSLLWPEAGADDERATALAEEWLARFPDMAENPEFDVIHRLLESRRFSLLATTAAKRLQTELSEGRRRNWQAVSFLVAFEPTKDAEAIRTEPQGVGGALRAAGACADPGGLARRHSAIGP